MRMTAMTAQQQLLAMPEWQQRFVFATATIGSWPLTRLTPREITAQHGLIEGMVASFLEGVTAPLKRRQRA